MATTNYTINKVKRRSWIIEIIFVLLTINCLGDFLQDGINYWPQLSRVLYLLSYVLSAVFWFIFSVNTLKISASQKKNDELPVRLLKRNLRYFIFALLTFLLYSVCFIILHIKFK